MFLIAKNKIIRSLLRTVSIGLMMCLPLAVMAADESVAGMPLSWMTMNACGGLALFLFGMEQMTDSLKSVAGGHLQSILAKATNNRVSGAFIGALVTAIIQSSSVTTVLVVGFVSAGLMTLNQSIGVIMGANIGTTITAQVIAFKVTKIALLFVASGFALLFLGRREQVKLYGNFIFGLGLVFFGMSIMSDAMIPLREYQPFLDLMVRVGSPLLGLSVGAIFTAFIQSSSATTAIVIVLAGQGFISLPAGIAVAMGANVGTCVTAMLAAIGKPRVALRAAVVHIVFNLAGVLLWIGFIDFLASLATSFSPVYPKLTGLAKVSAETPRQIANANTFFNLANTFVFIFFVPLFGIFVTRLFPDRPATISQPIIVPKYLDNYLIETPSAALDMVRLEIGQLGYQVVLMMTMATTALEKKSVDLFREIEKADDLADILHRAILEYLSQVGKQSLTDAQSLAYFRLIQAAETLESIGDILESDLSQLGLEILRIEEKPSATTTAILAKLLREVTIAVTTAVRAVVDDDQHAAQEVIAMRRTVNDEVERAFHQQVNSLAKSDLQRLRVLQLEFEMTDRLKQIYSLSKRIARLYVAREV